jgi:hypothetical protein
MAEDFETLLRDASPDVRRLALDVRALVLRLMPESVIETVEGGDAGYGTAPGYRGLVCVITPQRDYVTLGLTDAVDLPDPGGLLRGTGRRHRHVRLTPQSDLGDPNLKALILACLERHQHGR